ncbi:MAG: hypothetical protein MUF47_00835 [Porphyrobacter sp.]|jgi:hypothetical protein|nr:hypothetical protein [Porphyrobacter sp.]
MSAPEPVRTADQMTASELIDLAWDYAEDGAFFSAARCLRAAADRLEARGRQLHAQMGITPEQRP